MGAPVSNAWSPRDDSIIHAWAFTIESTIARSRGGFQIRKPGTIVGWLIAINIAVFLVDVLLRKDGRYGGPVNDLLGLQSDDLLKPWALVAIPDVRVLSPIHGPYFRGICWVCSSWAPLWSSVMGSASS